MNNSRNSNKRSLPHKRRTVQWITFSCLTALGFLALVPLHAQPAGPAVRFAPLYVYLDPRGEPLAAYQFELQAPAGVKIVGVEGGEHPAYQEPPYYDPAALMNNRIIIAAYNTAYDLPAVKTRVAILHLQISGSIAPDFESELIIAADPTGRTIPAQLILQEEPDHE